LTSNPSADRSFPRKPGFNPVLEGFDLSSSDIWTGRKGFDPFRMGSNLLSEGSNPFWEGSNPRTSGLNDAGEVRTSPEGFERLRKGSTVSGRVPADWENTELPVSKGECVVRNRRAQARHAAIEAATRNGRGHCRIASGKTGRRTRQCAPAEDNENDGYECNRETTPPQHSRHRLTRISHQISEDAAKPVENGIRGGIG
jgi:hypothetical protein